MVCLPPHSTHRLQPLDVAFMKPFKTFYNQEIEKWISCNAGNTIVSQYEVAELMGKAYIRAATMSNAMSGFRAAGIYPFDPSVFTEAHFIEEVNNSRPIFDTENVPTVPQPSETPEVDPPPATEAQGVGEGEPSQSSLPSDVAETVSPKDIRPVPKIKPPTARKRKGGECAELTSSPYKKKLEDFYAKKNNKNSQSCSGTQRQNKNNQNKNKQNNKKEDKQKRKRRVSSSSDGEDPAEPQLESDDDQDIIDPESADATCAFCNDSYSDDFTGQNWLMCSTCFNWNHQYCDAASGEGRKYICSYCRND